MTISIPSSAPSSQGRNSKTPAAVSPPPTHWQSQPITTLLPLRPVQYLIFQHLCLLSPTTLAPLSRSLHASLTPRIYRRITLTHTNFPLVTRGLVRYNYPNGFAHTRTLSVGDAYSVRTLTDVLVLWDLSQHLKRRERRPVFDALRRLHLGAGALIEIAEGFIHALQVLVTGEIPPPPPTDTALFAKVVRRQIAPSVLCVDLPACFYPDSKSSTRSASEQSSMVHCLTYMVREILRGKVTGGERWLRRVVVHVDLRGWTSEEFARCNPCAGLDVEVRYGITFSDPGGGGSMPWEKSRMAQQVVEMLWEHYRVLARSAPVALVRYDLPAMPWWREVVEEMMEVERVDGGKFWEFAGCLRVKGSECGCREGLGG
ncbi:hypothetical protein IAT38_005828 [Cryptococcus sp. DSM 104549]